MTAPKLMVTTREAADILSIGMTELYALVNSSRLEKRYIGKGSSAYRIPVSSLQAYVESLPTEPVEDGT